MNKIIGQDSINEESTIESSVIVVVAGESTSLMTAMFHKSSEQEEHVLFVGGLQKR